MIKKFENFDGFEEDDFDWDETEDIELYILYSYEDDEYLFFINMDKKLYCFHGTKFKEEDYIANITIKTSNNKIAYVSDYTEYYYDSEFETVGQDNIDLIKEDEILISNNYDNDYLKTFKYSDIVKMFSKTIKFILPHERDLV